MQIKLEGDSQLNSPMPDSIKVSLISGLPLLPYVTDLIQSCLNKSICPNLFVLPPAEFLLRTYVNLLYFFDIPCWDGFLPVVFR